MVDYKNPINHHTQLIKVFAEHFGFERPIVGVEIGTKCGDSGTQILNHFPNCKKLYTIDPWVHVDGGQFEAGEPQPYHDKNMGLAVKRLAQFGERVEIMHMTSAMAYDELLKRDPNVQFDFVWIDGDHSEAGITTDLNLYEGLVKDGGIFGGHDFGQCHPLTEIIDERYGEVINTGVDFTWWVYM